MPLSLARMYSINCLQKIDTIRSKDVWDGLRVLFPINLGKYNEIPGVCSRVFLVIGRSQNKSWCWSAWGGAPSSFRVGNLGEYNEILGFVSRVVFDIRSHKKSLSARGRLGRCSGFKPKKV